MSGSIVRDLFDQSLIDYITQCDNPLEGELYGTFRLYREECFPNLYLLCPIVTDDFDSICIESDGYATNLCGAVIKEFTRNKYKCSARCFAELSSIDWNAERHSDIETRLRHQDILQGIGFTSMINCEGIFYNEALSKLGWGPPDMKIVPKWSFENENITAAENVIAAAFLHMPLGIEPLNVRNYNNYCAHNLNSPTAVYTPILLVRIAVECDVPGSVYASKTELRYSSCTLIRNIVAEKTHTSQAIQSRRYHRNLSCIESQSINELFEITEVADCISASATLKIGEWLLAVYPPFPTRGFIQWRIDIDIKCVALDQHISGSELNAVEQRLQHCCNLSEEIDVLILVTEFFLRSATSELTSGMEGRQRRICVTSSCPTFFTPSLSPLFLFNHHHSYPLPLLSQMLLSLTQYHSDGTHSQLIPSQLNFPMNTLPKDCVVVVPFIPVALVNGWSALNQIGYVHLKSVIILFALQGACHVITTAPSSLSPHTSHHFAVIQTLEIPHMHCPMLPTSSSSTAITDILTGTFLVRDSVAISGGRM
ncbi:hypothetical protein GYMLUDRAFT_251608 [Collybiopsis luxurians FD-317 M1]|uniref:Uncharacterized protein n=1 Tax=Collybiopsis luxurians FD-317 M1 TaxID=944289 RepID=A0A0D0C258_9AGAR|nr:hypothetical protein GYMLUDRAFT_251608 [Collybiopsis luxurians FD-317 M1]